MSFSLWRFIKHLLSEAPQLQAPDRTYRSRYDLHEALRDTNRDPMELRFFARYIKLEASQGRKVLRDVDSRGAAVVEYRSPRVQEFLAAGEAQLEDPGTLEP